MEHFIKAYFQYSVCGRNYRKRYQLTEQMIINIGEKPYDCSVCDNTIQLKSDHESHMRTCSDEKPYGCSVCLKVTLIDWIILTTTKEVYDNEIHHNTLVELQINNTFL